MQLTRDFQIVGARSIGLWPLHLESPLAFRYVGQFKFQFIDTVLFKHQENSAGFLLQRYTEFGRSQVEESMPNSILEGCN